MEFSRRHGFRQGPILQTEDIDPRLRSALYNAVHVLLLDPFYQVGQGPSSFVYAEWVRYFELMWGDCFRQPLNRFSGLYAKVMKYISDRMQLGDWHDVYDLIEWICINPPRRDLTGFNVQTFKERCNLELERENSAFRIIGDLVTPITDAIEMTSIEGAQLLVRKYELLGISEHLKTAQLRISDREKPDYRNCIKESISAIEGLANIINGSKKETLGNALKTVQRSGKVKLPGQMVTAFDKLYSYTSDKDGIRHFLLDEPSASNFADAKFMLVSCSAFVHYLIQKAEEAGVPLKGTPAQEN